MPRPVESWRHTQITFGIIVLDGAGRGSRTPKGRSPADFESPSQSSKLYDNRMFAGLP